MRTTVVFCTLLLAGGCSKSCSKERPVTEAEVEKEQEQERPLEEEKAPAEKKPLPEEPVPALLTLLDDHASGEIGKFRVSHEALGALGRMGPAAAEAAPVLASRLTGDDQKDEDLYRALSGIGKAAVPALLKLIEQSEGGPRNAAIEALGRIGPDAVEAKDVVMEMFEEADVDGEVVTRVLVAMDPGSTNTLVWVLESGYEAPALDALRKAEKNSPKLVPALAYVMRNGIPTSQMSAATLLGRLGPRAAKVAPALVRGLRSDECEKVQKKAYEDDAWTECPVREASALALARIGPLDEKTVAALEKALEKAIKEDDEKTRKAVSLALCRAGALEIVTRNLDDPRPMVRGTAAFSVGCMLGTAPEVQDLFEKALGGEEQVRLMLLEGLSHAEPKRGVPVLAGLLEHEDWKVRRDAAVMLGDVGKEASSAVPALVKALGDEKTIEEDCDCEPTDKTDHPVVEAAAEALGAIGPAASQAVDELTQMLGSKDPDLRYDAYYAIGRIGKADPAVKYLVRLLEGEEPMVWNDYYPAEALASIGPPARKAVPALIKALDTTDEDMISAVGHAIGEIVPPARDAVPGLVELLEHKSSEVRSEAFHLIVELYEEDAKVLESIAELLGHEKRAVRGQALELLGRLGDRAGGAVPAVIERVEKAGDDRLEAILVLGQIGRGNEEAARVLLELLDDEELRPHVCEALGSIGPVASDAAPRVVPLLGHENPDVRAAAARALGGILAPE